MLNIDRSLTGSQIRKLNRLLDLVENPEKFGCAFDKGDPETYQARAGHIIDAAADVVDDLLDPIAPQDRGRAELISILDAKKAKLEIEPERG